MDISEVRVKLVSNAGDRLKAYCSITLDRDFVVRDLKIIDGTSGPFVAMPSRKLCDKCDKCGYKNHLRAKFCNNCGTRLPERQMTQEELTRSKLHADIAHPINSECRTRIQESVIEAYLEEVEKAKEPDYSNRSSSYDDWPDFDEEDVFDPDSNSFGKKDEDSREMQPEMAISDDDFGAGIM